jgi:hypothetical protein
MKHKPAEAMRAITTKNTPKEEKVDISDIMKQIEKRAKKGHSDLEVPYMIHGQPDHLRELGYRVQIGGSGLIISWRE